MRTQDQYQYTSDFSTSLPNSLNSFFSELRRISSITLDDSHTSMSATSHIANLHVRNRRTADFVILGQEFHAATENSINLVSRHVNLTDAEEDQSEQNFPIKGAKYVNLRTLDNDLFVLVFVQRDAKILWVVCKNPQVRKLEKNKYYDIMVSSSNVVPLSNFLPDSVAVQATSLQRLDDLIEKTERVKLTDQHGDMHTKNVLFSDNDFVIFDLGSAREDLASTDFARFCISFLKDLSILTSVNGSSTELAEHLANASMGFFASQEEEIDLDELHLSLEVQKILYIREIVEEELVLRVISGKNAPKSRIDDFLQLANNFLLKLSNILNSRSQTSSNQLDRAANQPNQTVSQQALPVFALMVKKALTRKNRQEPIGTAKKFYDYFLESNSLGNLTPLQKVLEENANTAPFVFDSSCHILMSGPTSSGKTTASDLFLFRTIFTNDGDNARALFLSPTKALAREKYEALQSVFQKFQFPDNVPSVLISTGDESDSDPLIASGHFRIACTVYEKANILFSRNPAILSQIGLVVVDELHMFTDLERGPLLELIVAKLQKNRSEHESETKSTSMEELRPRILGISTDLSLVRAFRGPLTITPPQGSPLPPIEISDHTRPTTVNHTLVMPIGTECEHEKIFIGSTDEEAFPFLSDEKRDLVVEAAIDAFNSYREAETCARENKKNRPAKHLERVISFLNELIDAKPYGERILCFVPGRRTAESVASVLATRRQLSGSSADANTETLREGLTHVEDQAVRHDLASFYKKRVYVHHSDLPFETLRSIEEVCREPLAATSETEVIVATQTLSYGVNLAVSIVCISEQKFYTSVRKGDAQRAPLSSCEFHNMLGRCGRYGLTNGKPSNAYILFKIENRMNEVSADAFIQKYYSMADLFESAVFTSEDKNAEKLVRNRTSFRYGDDKNSSELEFATTEELIKGVTKFSFPFVRAILDALRHLNFEYTRSSTDGRATFVGSDEIIELLEWTPFGQGHLRNERSKRSIAEVFQYVLRALKQKEYRLTREPEYTTFVITERGDAILNTGMAIQSIQEFQTFIDLCKDISDGLNIDPATAKLLVPYITLLIVISQPEAMRTSAQYTAEHIHPPTSEEQISALKSQVIDEFSDLLGEIIGGDSLEVVPKEVLEFLFDVLAKQDLSHWGQWAKKWEDENKRFYTAPSGLSDRRVVTTIIFRVASFTLAWILGKSSREMKRFLHPPGTEAKSMKRFMGQMRFFEGISYGVVFFSALVRTSEEVRKTADEQLAYRLQVLSEQIRLGLRAAYLPFASLQSRSATRQNIVAACKSGLTVTNALTDNLPDLSQHNIPIGSAKSSIGGFFLTRFVILSSAWAEKARHTDDKLVVNQSELWNFLKENYSFFLGNPEPNLTSGDVATKALETLFDGFLKKLELNVSAIGDDNIDKKPSLVWRADHDLLLEYNYIDEDTVGTTRRSMFFRFVECGENELLDLNGHRITSTNLSYERYDEYWFVNVSPNPWRKHEIATTFSERMRIENNQKVCIIEFDAFFVMVCAILRGFFDTLDTFFNMYGTANAKYFTVVDVTAQLSDRETVSQIRKACVEYVSLWSYENDLLP